MDTVGQTFALLTTLIATGGAIAGGVVGSTLTSRQTRAQEERKRLEQKEEERQFNARIREIVRYELEFISYVLGNFFEGKELDKGPKTLIRSLIDFQREYPKMSLDRRVSVFDPQALSKIEHVYQIFGMFAAAFDNEYPKYLEKTITFEVLKNNLDTKVLKNQIDEALKLLNKDTKL